MFLLGRIERRYGSEWFLGNDGWWHRRADNPDGGFKLFGSEDEAVDWAWSHDECRLFGATYFGEEV